MSRIALYRKYRPTNFDEVFGQRHIKTILKNSFKENRFSHAYIFFGPRGVGKTSVARIVAKALNCEKPIDGNPCNKCNSCVEINEQRALDVIEIDAASNRGIDEIRDLREKVKFSPSGLKYKVFIIDEVHMLTKEAFNALLKTLEEPPEHAVFILATTEIHKILPTVISRCQRFDFRRIAQEDLVERLTEIAKKEGVKIEPDAIDQIAAVSDGGLRDAVSILDQISLNNKKTGNITKEEVYELIGAVDSHVVGKIFSGILEGNKKETLTAIAEAMSKGADIAQLTKGLLEEFRTAIDKNISDATNLRKYIYGVEILNQNLVSYRHMVHPQLSLEVAVLKIINVFSQERPKEEKQAIAPKETFKKETQKEAEQEPVDQESSEIGEKWPKVLFEIKSVNNSIHAFVREADPEFTSDKVVLHFPYRFHKERIEDAKNKAIVEKVISKVCGSDVAVICKLTERKFERPAHQPKKPASAPGEPTPLDILGGELVE